MFVSTLRTLIETKIACFSNNLYQIVPLLYQNNFFVRPSFQNNCFVSNNSFAWPSYQIILLYQIIPSFGLRIVTFSLYGHRIKIIPFCQIISLYGLCIKTIPLYGIRIKIILLYQIIALYGLCIRIYFLRTAFV